MSPLRHPDAPLLVVVGPTASGKTSLSLRLSEALGGEIIGADSVQIYRGFDIGSGKPSRAERARVTHHLVDAFAPDEAVDAAQWVALADRAIAEVRSRGRVPVVCGGTFLWVRSLLQGLAPMPAGDPTVRARHAALAESEGRAALHAELARVDPEAAARLAPNDLVRVSRSLEVHELTGTPQSEWHRRHGLSEERHVARLVGIHHDPEALSARIEQRTRSMLDAGWVDEVLGLIEGGHRQARAMGSVGYRQIAEALDAGEAQPATLLPDIVRATRIFARRQRTWLRERAVAWLPESLALAEGEALTAALEERLATAASSPEG